MESDALMLIFSGLLGAGGILGAKGLLDRYVTGQQQRQTTMASAVVQMAQDLSTAMVGLAKDTIQANHATALQLVTNLESFKVESGHQYRFLREEVEGNTEKLAQLDGHVILMNQRLSVIVEHLANGKSVRDG